MTSTRRARGATDPTRRARIAQVAVVAKHGIAGLTHRRVPEEARVPLGSTTYNYATLEDLLTAALEHAVRESEERVRARGESIDDPAEIPAALFLASKPLHVRFVVPAPTLH